MMKTTRGLASVELLLTGVEAARRFATPPEYARDFAVVPTKPVVLGSSAAAHGLSGLKGRAFAPARRFVGSAHAPFLASAPLSRRYTARTGHGEIRNFDIFGYLLDGTKT